MKRLALTLVLGCTLVWAMAAHAVPVGVLSFDILIPPDPTDGVNTFAIGNFTGDPAAGGSALPPDFPAMTGVSFLGASLRVVQGGSTQVIPLGDIGPGTFPDPLAELQFPDSAQFDSATFIASLSETSLLLSDGSTFLASRAISARLVSAEGSFLVAGSDFVLLEASPASVGVPAPWPWALVGAGLAGLWASTAAGGRRIG